MAFHPEGMASLIAAILVTGDVAMLPENEQYNGINDLKVMDFRRSQVLELAREYYKCHPCNFDTSKELWRDGYATNGKNNLAKLSRSNLKNSRPR